MSIVEIGQYWVNKRGEFCEVIADNDSEEASQPSYEMRIKARAWGRHRLGDTLYMHAIDRYCGDWFEPENIVLWDMLCFILKIREPHD